jgi:hypothetical protein
VNLAGLFYFGETVMAAEDAIGIVKTGSVIAFGAASASVAIPTDSSGSIPKYIRVAANSACYVKIGPTGTIAVAGDALVQPADAMILKTHNYGFIAAIQVAAGGTVQISPLEDR